MQEEKIINSLNDISYTLSNYYDFSLIQNTVQVYKKRGTTLELLDIDIDYTLTSNASASTNVISPTSTLDLKLSNCVNVLEYIKDT